MKKRGIKYAFISLILVMAMLLSPVAPAIRLHQVTMLWETMRSAGMPLTNVTSAQAQEPEGSTIYLPLLTTALGPPAFEIMSPANGGTISGVMYFAVQPTDAATVESVTFKAGSTELGTDSDASDGFKVFLNASDLPAGPLQLSAIGTGPSGETTKTITVNVLPNPPSSGTLDSQGGVLASEIGSIITFPPGAVPDGTDIAVTEMTQEEVTQENGFDWDAMGVTFLGAQKIQSTATFSQPLGVASAGFGNRVQPGQAVVNYRIAPDADGDGVDELIVVNTASVAPNGDVISDPVPQITIGEIKTILRGETSSIRNLNDGISGPLGTIIEIEADGFNPYSVLGNVAVFRSSVDGTQIELHGSITLELDGNSGQIFSVVIPPLPAGPATLTLRNESTNATLGPIELTVEPSAPLSKPANEIIADFFAETLTFLYDIQSSTGEEIESVNDIINELTMADQIFKQLADDKAPEVQQYLTDMATMIKNSDILTELNQSRICQLSHLGLCLPKNELKALKFKLVVSGALFGLGCVLIGIVNPIAGGLCGFEAAILYGAIDIYIVGDIKPCEESNPSLPVCLPAQSNGGGNMQRQALGGGSAITGMGAAPPPGGNSCGNAAGGAEGSLRNQRGGGFGLEPGRFVIKVFSSGFRTPFSGVTDAGGYFFIPLIPEAEPFTALAIDTATGQTRSYSGSGPAIGESSFMFFDFFSEDDGSTPIEIGDVIVREIIPGETNVYSFSAEAGQAIYFDEQSASGTVRWRLLDQSGNRIFDEILADSDPGTYTLTEGGTYNIFVQSTIYTIYEIKFCL